MQTDGSKNSAQFVLFVFCEENTIAVEVSLMLLFLVVLFHVNNLKAF